MLPDTVIRRLPAAIERAEEAFWRVIADSFPEVKFGDVDPSFVMRRAEHNIEDVKSWLVNHPAYEDESC